MTEVVVVGSLNMDTVIRVAKLPLPGETVKGTELLRFPGGKGANQATALARLGTDVALLGKIGNDEHGKTLQKILIDDGVDVSGVAVSQNQQTGTALIVVENSGNNQIIVFGGANNDVDIRYIESQKAVLTSAKTLLVQFEIPVETIVYLVDFAHENKIPIVINPSPYHSIDTHVIKKIDYLVLNELEAGSFLSAQISSIQDGIEAVKGIKSKGVKNVVLTLGGEGAVICDIHGNVAHIPAFSVHPLDTTASGDAFLGGLLHALLDGKSLLEAVSFANGVGALTATKMGAQSSLPRLEEVHRFLIQH